MLGGEGVFDLGTEDVPLQKGDAVLVPVGVEHGLRVVGDTRLQILLIFARPSDLALNGNQT